MALFAFEAMFTTTLQCMLKLSPRNGWWKLWRLPNIAWEHCKDRFQCPKDCSSPVKWRIRIEATLTCVLLPIFAVVALFGLLMTLYTGGVDATSVLGTFAPHTWVLLLLGYGLTTILSLPGEAIFCLEAMQITVDGWVKSLGRRVEPLLRWILREGKPTDDSSVCRLPSSSRHVCLFPHSLIPMPWWPSRSTRKRRKRPSERRASRRLPRNSRMKKVRKKRLRDRSRKSPVR